MSFARNSLMILMCLGVILLFFLGFWQLKRAEKKQILINHFKTNTQAPSIPLEQIPKEQYDHLVYQKISFSGKCLKDFPFLLDNQIENKQVGYRLYYPIEFQPNQLILVDFGFLKAPINRTVFPKLPKIPNHFRKQTGYIVKPVKNFILNKIPPAHNQKPYRLQYLDFDWISQITQKETLSLTVSIKIPKQRMMPKEKHLAYAGQWFLLGFTLMGYIPFFYRGCQKKTLFT